MTTPTPSSPRAALRRSVLEARQLWANTPAAEAAQAALHERLQTVLAQLEPDGLGLYWPVKGEFNPRPVALSAQQAWGCKLALPFAQRQPVAMHFRPWTGGELSATDECGIPTPDTKVVVQPDVLLVPCVGFTTEGYRLGYGGGYFDRYLAAHPDVTAIGIAWDDALVNTADLAPAAHDIPLMAVITPSQVWGG